MTKKSDSKDKLYAMRHSLAHIMAYAISELWPDAQFGVGPVIENGFYYDINTGDKPISEDDFGRIEKVMGNIIKAGYEFEQLNLTIKEAVDWAKKSKQPFKLELLNDLQRAGTTIAKDLDSEELGLPADSSKVSKVSFYKSGEFIDLCRGPHLKNTGEAGYFKLIKIAGAYWRGNEKNPQLQRLYGVAFRTKKDLDEYLYMLEESKKRDHRKLGQEMDLFVFSDLVGSGLPMFTPKGTILRDELDRFSQELQAEGGYQRVTIPHITKVELYKISGHYDKYPERFTVTSEESKDEFMMKPMNCPHHIQIYASRQRSYRDLPIRYMESTMVYRDEKAGELHGLSRVRAATQDDGHAFCRPEQIEEEFEAIANMVKIMYRAVFDMEFRVRLAFRDESDNYLGDNKLWEIAQSSVEKIAKHLKFDYEVEEGEATFYGPKIEFVVKDSLGREWQCATIQLDFISPQRFNLSYVDSDGLEKQPVMIHKALLGSIERFMAVYIEHTEGKFPIWLSPEQIRIATVNQEEKTVKFAEGIMDKAKALGLRVGLDNNNETVGKKIRSAQIAKIPYTVVIGDKEIESGKLIARVRDDLTLDKNEIATIAVDNFLKTIANEARSRVSKTSF